MVARIYDKLNTVLEQCVHSICFRTVCALTEQCSKYSRTVNGAASLYREAIFLAEFAMQFWHIRGCSYEPG